MKRTYIFTARAADIYIRLFLVLIVLAFAGTVSAQTAAFTYQGKLTDGSLPANGTYQMQFSLFDAATGTGQIGSTITNNTVAVAGGGFTVQLDFSPATPFAAGADRFIEIAVRKASDLPGFTLLTPRQQIASSPYSIKSLGAAAADALSTSCVLCVTDAHILEINGSKVTGAVSDAVNAVNAGNLTTTLPINKGGTGSTTKSFVDLTTDQTVGGNKTFTGTVSGDGSGLANLNGANIANNTINVSALAPEVTVAATTNSSLLGSLRWDLLSIRNFSVGTPRYVASDGANIWVTNLSSNTVTKLRISDGAVLGAFAVGTGPNGVVFDGANIWVANFTSGNVTKLRASDGACVGTCTFAVASPKGIIFDGASIWVTGGAGLTKLLASDGSVQGTFAVAVTSSGGIAFDGTSIWVTSSTFSVTKLRASDGALQGNFTVASNPQAIAFDGVNIWVASNTNASNVTKLKASDGTNLGTFLAGTFLSGIAFDGTNIWVSNSTSGTLTKLRVGDGVVVGTFSVGSSIASSPLGVVFDGANIWVTNSSQSSVTKVPAFP
jgi:hypothetical protein